MTCYVQAARRTLRSEWTYTYLSARREHKRTTAVRKLARELYKGLLDLPTFAREIRTHDKKGRPHGDQ